MVEAVGVRDSEHWVAAKHPERKRREKVVTQVEAAFYGLGGCLPWVTIYCRTWLRWCRTNACAIRPCSCQGCRMACTSLPGLDRLSRS